VRETWLAEGLDASAQTIRKNRDCLRPVLDAIGGKQLRELSADDVNWALSKVAATRSSATVSIAHSALTRAIRYAEARDLVSRNVAALVDAPKGRPGRRSRSLTMDQAVAVITAASEDRPPAPVHPGLRPQERRPTALMHAYIVVSLTTGLRTEEIRGLRWDHVVALVDGRWLPVSLLIRSLTRANPQRLQHLSGDSESLIMALPGSRSQATYSPMSSSRASRQSRPRCPMKIQ
jgi:integrase